MRVPLHVSGGKYDACTGTAGLIIYIYLFVQILVGIARLIVQKIKARQFVQLLACKTAERLTGRLCITDRDLGSFYK